MLLFLFSSQRILAFFLYLSIFAYCRRILICVFSLISHPGFEFLFIFFRGTRFLAHTIFVPSSICSFNSVMLFVFQFLFLLFSILVSKFFCTSSSRSPCPPSRVSSYTPSPQICCVCLSCDWSFRLYHHISDICYLVQSYLFSLWCDWFLWRYFVLLLDIQFLS